MLQCVAESWRCVDVNWINWQARNVMIAKIMAKTVSNGVMDLFLFPWLDNIHPNMELFLKGPT